MTSVETTALTNEMTKPTGKHKNDVHFYSRNNSSPNENEAFTVQLNNIIPPSQFAQPVGFLQSYTIHTHSLAHMHETYIQIFAYLFITV